MSSARVLLAAVEWVDASADYDLKRHAVQSVWKAADDRVKRAERSLKRAVAQYRGAPPKQSKNIKKVARTPSKASK